jgi:hypothetical protein
LWSSPGVSPWTAIFILYTADLCVIIKRHWFWSQLYADDTQIYNSCRPCDVNQLTDRLVVCLDDVFDWLRSNRLQPNSDKTEIPRHLFWRCSQHTWSVMWSHIENCFTLLFWSFTSATISTSSNSASIFSVACDLIDPQPHWQDQLRRLQAVQNSAAGLIFDLRCKDHISHTYCHYAGS